MQLLFTGAFRGLLFAQTVQNKKRFQWRHRGQNGLWHSSADEWICESILVAAARAWETLQETSFHLTLLSVQFFTYSSNLFNRQLDYNQISCIEDGAFRALRDLEVLWVPLLSLTLLTRALPLGSANVDAYLLAWNLVSEWFLQEKESP